MGHQWNNTRVMEFHMMDQTIWQIWNSTQKRDDKDKALLYRLDVTNKLLDHLDQFWNLYKVNPMQLRLNSQVFALQLNLANIWIRYSYAKITIGFENTLSINSTK